MDFSTISFWFSLIPAILVLQAGNRILKDHPLAKKTFHKGLISLLSLLLLGIASWQTLTIFVAVMLTTWFSCLYGMTLCKQLRRVLLCFQIPILLAPLFYYKYADFVCNSIAGQDWNTLRDLIIPIGISFYTFQLIGFSIDTLLKEKTIPSFIDYINFSSFFPQIVAGPIERRDDLLPQMQNINLELKSAQLKKGIPYIILGLFYKLTLADNLADAFFSHYTGTNSVIIWVNNLIFTFRIYFDFSGYGLTAYGIALCLGVTLRMNFLSPYTATNITEFWRRWHTSLTLWFRDYIYFPLGGSRTRRWPLNMLIIFLVSGIWHGAGWNFIIWGLLAGISMIIHRLWSKTNYRLPRFIGWSITFMLMVFVWMFFYETNPQILTQHLQSITTLSTYDITNFTQSLISKGASGVLIFEFLAMAFLVIIVELISLKKTGDAYHYLLSDASCGLMVFLIVILYTSSQNQFIYFSF